TSEHLIYYLETARPITDEVELYLTDQTGKTVKQKSGDKIPFLNRVLDHRKTIFKLNLNAGDKVNAYMSLKSDGEVISLPLVLRSSENLLRTTYFEQLIFGVFYGILILAFITYLFFFIALGDWVFFYYGCYVIFIALMQFSLDGYFYQYFASSGGWFSQRAVIIFAAISRIFLGKYGEVFLNIKKYIEKIFYAFRMVYGLLGLLLLSLLFTPSFLKFTYPLANIFGLAILALIVLSLVYFNIKKLPGDKFFGIGIFFLFLGFLKIKYLVFNSVYSCSRKFYRSAITGI
ncbi:MAG: hybrid sensor histidine kinase/response regulator, partial [Bacteroidia bacterium]|nr:hybrid sensor histidine kinase/response regulator [Bacteroidia bacterium]